MAKQRKRKAASSPKRLSSPRSFTSPFTPCCIYDQDTVDVKYTGTVLRPRLCKAFFCRWLACSLQTWKAERKTYDWRSSNFPPFRNDNEKRKAFQDDLVRKAESSSLTDWMDIVSPKLLFHLAVITSNRVWHTDSLMYKEPFTNANQEVFHPLPHFQPYVSAKQTRHQVS
jgi:hypothetical protein